MSECGALLARCSDKLAEAAISAVAGALHALGGRHGDASQLLDHARVLYEDIGSKRGLVLTWVPLAIDVHRLAGDLDTAEAIGRENVDTTAKTVDAYASTAAAQLAHLLVQRGDLEAADRYATLSEQTALDADVYVQFVWRAARARLLARAGGLAEAEAIGADAVAIASLTDALCDRAHTHFALAEVSCSPASTPRRSSKRQLDASCCAQGRDGASGTPGQTSERSSCELLSSDLMITRLRLCHRLPA